MKVLLILFLALPILLSALEIIRDGKPLAEIVVEEKACPSTQTAALELQNYLRQISGAKLPIVSQPGNGIPIYIGRSRFADKLGIKPDGIRYDGFQIIVTGQYAAIVGADQISPPIPRLSESYKKPNWVNANQEYRRVTGKKWECGLYWGRDNRDYRFGDMTKPLSFHKRDGTGTLYGVYELLEQLGCRFFMPIPEIGFVIPKSGTVNLPPMNRKYEPSFGMRIYQNVFPKTDLEFLWFKQLRIGGAFTVAGGHSAGMIADSLKDPEMLILDNNGTPTELPRLASPALRREVAEWIVDTRRRYPELDRLMAGQPDGWTVLDNRDRAAGWDKTAEGNHGRFSDYMWDFALDVARRVHAKDPGIQIVTYSYGFNKKAPKNIERIPGYIGVFLTQTSPDTRRFMEEDFILRKEWEKKAPESDLYLYDYYLYHSPRSGLPPIPVIFTKNLEKNLKNTTDQYKGVHLEISWTGMRKLNPDTSMPFPGLDHLMYYLHGKLTWDKHADLNALLEDYYQKFFGPAAPEMKEFYEFAESVWMRPEARQITRHSGFLKQADVERYFEILKRAEQKAGDTIYGKRIRFIAAEMEPVKKVFSNLTRTGPYLRARSIGKELGNSIVIDGNLEKPLWIRGHLADSFEVMKDNFTGAVPTVNLTKTAFRWAPDGSLLIGITCFDRRMNRLARKVKTTNDAAIWNDDTVEIFLETPAGYNIHMGVNPNGALWCHGITPDVTDLPASWHPAACAVKTYPDRWTVEIRLKGIGDRPTGALPWGINVCRTRQAEQRAELYSLSPTGGGFRNPKKMANLWSDIN